MLVRKIRLSKNKFVKAIFTNISAYELHKLLNISISNIPIIILNKNLIDLTEEDSDSGAAVFTIIGQNKHLKIKNNKHPKGIDEKKLSKDTILKNQKETLNQKKIAVKHSKEHKSIRVSEQKNLFTKVITITPYISPKHKMIMGEIQKDQINKLKQLKQKEKHPKVAVKKVNPTIKKSENKINKPSVTYISKIEKSKENTNKVIKKTSQPKISKVKPKQPRYSLQKKSSPGLVALFSATIASVLFSIGVAGIIGHKKTLPNVLIASSLAIIGLGMLANKKTHNKRLVKK